MLYSAAALNGRLDTTEQNWFLTRPHTVKIYQLTRLYGTISFAACAEYTRSIMSVNLWRPHTCSGSTPLTKSLAASV